MKLPSSSPLEAFGDIGHGGYGCALNLSGKAEIFSKPTLPRDLINSSSKLSGLLPRHQILKPLDLAHTLSTQPSLLTTQSSLTRYSVLKTQS